MSTLNYLLITYKNKYPESVEFVAKREKVIEIVKNRFDSELAAISQKSHNYSCKILKSRSICEKPNNFAEIQYLLNGTEKRISWVVYRYVKSPKLSELDILKRLKCCHDLFILDCFHRQCEKDIENLANFYGINVLCDVVCCSFRQTKHIFAQQPTFSKSIEQWVDSWYENYLPSEIKAKSMYLFDFTNMGRWEEYNSLNFKHERRLWLFETYWGHFLKTYRKLKQDGI